MNKVWRIVGCCVLIVSSSQLWAEDESIGQWDISGKMESADPFIGVKHTQIIQQIPRPTVINIIEINPKAEGIRFLCSPANGDPNGDEPGDPNLEVTRLHTFDYVKQTKAQIGINTAFYGSISNEHHFADIKGLAASEGDVYSNFYKGWPALNITADNQAMLIKSAEPKANNAKTIPSNAPLYNTIGGSHILLENGVMPETKRWSFTTGRHPRTAVGWKEDGTILLVIVDGRQARFSEGMTLFELADLFRDLSCVNAINLDGGGSTTLVMGDPNVRIANNPSDTFENGETGRARFVAASLLVFAKPNPEYTKPIVMAIKPKPIEALPYPQEKIVLHEQSIGSQNFVKQHPTSVSNIGIEGEITSSLHNAAHRKSHIAEQFSFQRSTQKSKLVMRHLYGEGEPKGNIALGRVGTIGYWLRTTNKNLKASIILDDSANPNTNKSKGEERGSTIPIIGDGEWHFYEWDLRVVDHWFNFDGGSGVIDGPNTTLDSILILQDKEHTQVGETMEIMIDTIVYDPKGKMRQ
ncbi:hypothetical protein KS4_34930 [Poriferisphaera corsica]|uniref:Phosphodiester glycosidase domain-containing protein n=1 Tax=Poriferisphaera corsica TaxID=2528020 RepID=A0A517YYW2_9BACT|nr:phosphodiester glycosidase family protein [Poriferisphaera corsica]QDU35412.1 hypothetical protein KS4_34930 [Poriferisphaera corsica]